jgi:hypothetical protein
MLLIAIAIATAAATAAATALVCGILDIAIARPELALFEYRIMTKKKHDFIISYFKFWN